MRRIKEMAFEFQILDFLQTVHTPLLDKIMIGASTLGNTGYIWIALALILLIIPKTRPVGKVLVLALLCEILLANVVLKPIVHRARPFVVNTSVRLIVDPPTDYSFPSGHAGMAFTVVSGLYLMKSKRLCAVSAILAVIISFSRLYLYVHYPTDVLAGILLGLFSGWAGYQMYQFILRKKEEKCKKVNIRTDQDSMTGPDE